MLKGTVKFFNKAKGFGFITPDDGDKEIFLPASVVPGAEAARLKTGQRVSFEQAPDTKGPKVVALTFLDEAPKLPEPVAPRLNITVFHAAADPASAEVIATLTDHGHQPRLVDYMVTPPPPDELKRLSLLLNGADQSLVRRYDPLFFELQLDDRFITEGEFWTAVSEHPQLINGPVVMTANKVRICRDDDDIREFLGVDADARAAKPKALSPRVAAMMMGVEPPPPAPPPPAAPAPQAIKPKPVVVTEQPPAPVETPVVAAPVKAKAKAPVIKTATAVAKPKPAAAKAVAPKPAAPKTKKATPEKAVRKAVKAVKKTATKPAKKKAAPPAAKAKKKR